MPARILLAFLGAGAITAMLLLGMHQVAEQLKLRDPTRFFRISDVIALPQKRLAKPATPQRPPQRAAPELGPTGPTPIAPSPPQPPGVEDPSLTVPEVAPPTTDDAFEPD